MDLTPEEWPSLKIESLTTDGTCFLAASSVATALRKRADEVDAQRPQVTDLDELVRSERYVHSIAYEAIARELRSCSDAIEFGVIAHLAETEETIQEPSPSEHTQDGGERRGLDPETLPQWERELLERQRWYPKPPADTSWISVAVEYRRPWWRRLLRLPAKREDRGTFAVEAWGEVGQTPPGGTMNVPESGE